MLIPTFLILSFFSFIIMEFAPGDPAITMLGESAAWGRIEELRKELGLDKPLLVRYFNWLKGIVVHGDLGRSVLLQESVTTVLARRIPRTAWLALLSFSFIVFLGIPAGIFSAIYAGTLVDRLIMAICTLLLATPIFLVGLFLMWLFAVHYKIFPVAGYVSPCTNFVEGIKSLILPSFAISTMYIAYVARMTRSAVLEVLIQDFVRTAYSKGVPQVQVVLRHVLKASLVPIMTASSLTLAGLLGGTIVSETLFVIPGIGRLMFDSAVRKDYVVLQALLLFAGMVYYLMTFVLDIWSAIIDPRIRVE